MGEPATPIYTRIYKFALWPFDSTTDLANYAEWVTDLVRQAAQVEPSAVLSLNVLTRGTEPPMPVDELRDRIDEFPLDKVFQGSLEVRTDDLSLTLALNDHVLGNRESSVTVVGADKDTVDRIKSKVQEEGEARIEAEERRKDEAEAQAKAEADFKRQEAAAGIGDTAQAIFEAEAQRERERERERGQRKRPLRPTPLPPAPTPHPAPEPRKGLWQAFKDADNQAQIIGGGIVTLIVAIIIALLFGAG
jgi:hypothetical protein